MAVGGSRPDHRVPVEALGHYAHRIDVRSPSEFAEDHVPGADNHPVLDDAQRARVGTMHAQASAFDARRAGAALVARAIAAMLEGPFADRARDWVPLVYCWRGGQRSRSLVHILNEIGWRAVQLDGGYRAYRRHVVARLQSLPPQFRYRVVCGLTGSGKSRLIAALAAEGAQALDLEALARHRGSLLGDLPGEPQPSQKAFESALLASLEGYDRARPVYVESESRRIGTLQLPEALVTAMRASECIRLATPTTARIALLKEEYAHFLGDHAALAARFARLVPLHGKATIERWLEAAAQLDWDALVGEILVHHYDPMYTRAMARNFPRVSEATVVAPVAVTPTAFRSLAREIDAELPAQHVADLHHRGVMPMPRVGR